MRLKDMAESTSDLFNIPVDRLDVDGGFNVREDSDALRAHIATLAADMLANGFLRSKPLTIRFCGDRAIVVDGHCRLAAVRLAVADGAPILTVPCLPEPKGTSAQDRNLLLLKSNSGLPLTPLEQAAVVKRLLSFGWSEAQVGAKLGRTRQHVANLLDLAAAPDEVKAMVIAGTVSPTEAVRAIRAEGEGAAAVIREAASVSPNGRATGGWIKSVRNGEAGEVRPKRERVPVVAEAEGDGCRSSDAYDEYRLREAVRVFLAAWDDTTQGGVVAAVDALRELVS